MNGLTVSFHFASHIDKKKCKLYKILAEFIQINHFISKLKDFLVDLLPYVLKFTEFCQMENFFLFNTTFKTLWIK